MVETLVKMLQSTAHDYGEVIAQIWRSENESYEKRNYRELYELILDFAAALKNIGIKRQDLVGLISDNRNEWLVANMAILALGAADVPRGCDTTGRELEKIFSLTELASVVTENAAQTNKILEIKKNLPKLKTVITFDAVDEKTLSLIKENEMDYYSFDFLLKEGKKWRIENKGLIEKEVEAGKEEELASLIFTSGTTGTPKGVMLTHKNFLAQLDELPERIILNPGDRALSVLPVWHAFERSCEYVIIIQSGCICYSKPLSNVLLDDFKKLNPVLMPAVPRVFEAIYQGIERKMRKTGGIVLMLYRFFTRVALIHSRMQRKMFNQNTVFTRYYTPLWWVLFFIPWVLLFPLKWLGNLLVFRKIKSMLGTSFRAGVAGGGSYPKVVDEFFWSIGVNIVEGYGLTETAPIISVRPITSPVFGNVGSPLRGLKARIVDSEGYVLGRGKFGSIQIKGATVMSGYYKREDLTAKVMTVDDWFDTGDLGFLSVHDEIVIKGRKKDTIVLRGGENVEPVPIEQKLELSKFIKNAVVVGQDERYLSALILVDKDEVLSYAATNGVQFDSFEGLLQSEEIQQLYNSEITSLVNAKEGFRIFERISKFALITKPFEVGVELSAKQEVMRYRMTEIYKNEIEEMFKDN